jgi:hypothetical protein
VGEVGKEGNSEVTPRQKPCLCQVRPLARVVFQRTGKVRAKDKHKRSNAGYVERYKRERASKASAA